MTIATASPSKPSSPARTAKPKPGRVGAIGGTGCAGSRGRAHRRPPRSRPCSRRRRRGSRSRSAPRPRRAAMGPTGRRDRAGLVVRRDHDRELHRGHAPAPRRSASWISRRIVVDAELEPPVRDSRARNALRSLIHQRWSPTRGSRVELPVELSPGDLLAERDRLEHRAVAVPARRRCCRRPPARGLVVERGERPNEVGAVDVVAHLLAAVAVDRVALAGDRAAHQVREEAVQLRARRGSGPVRQPPRKHDRRHVEVAPVLLHEQVGGRLRDAEERVEARGRSTSTSGSRRSTRARPRQLEPRLELDERQEVRAVAVDLVRRREDERRVGPVPRASPRAGSACRWR